MTSNIDIRDGVAWIRLDAIEGAFALTDASGILVTATKSGHDLLSRLGKGPGSHLEFSDESAEGKPSTWSDPSGLLVGYSTHRLGDDRYSILVMREIGEHNKELARRLHAQRLEVTGRLAAVIAHDLRMPLSSIMLNADTLARMPAITENPGALEAVEDMAASAGRLRRTVGEFLDFAESRTSDSDEVDLDEAFGRVSALLRPMLRDRAAYLYWEIGHNAKRVRANSLVVEQALLNLIGNGIEAAGQGAEIRVTAVRSGLQVLLRVADNGPGVSPEAQARLFEPFFTTKPAGLGVGLTLTRESLHAVGGAINLEASSPDGACFRVDLPALQTTAAATNKEVEVTLA